MVLLLAGLLGTPGCGNHRSAIESPDQECLTIDEVKRLQLDAPDWAPFGVAALDSRLDKLRKLVFQVETGERLLRTVPAAEIKQRLLAADVVFVGDVHNQDACRALAREIVVELAAGRVSRALSVCLEALPSSCRTQLTSASDGGGDPDVRVGMDMLRLHWPMPVESYLPLLHALQSAGAELVPAGAEPLGRVRDDSLSDWMRSPYTCGAPTLLLLPDALEKRFRQIDRCLRASIVGELKEGRRVVALVGLAHVFGDPDALPHVIQCCGYETVTVLPYYARLSLAIYAALECVDPTAWYEIQPGTYHAPLPSLNEIKQRNRARRKRSDYLLNAIRKLSGAVEDG